MIVIVCLPFRTGGTRLSVNSGDGICRADEASRVIGIGIVTGLARITGTAACRNGTVWTGTAVGGAWVGECAGGTELT